ncbi:MAG: hypothetical protein CYPHOPRED_002394 [Cyphobasidiales sp. Tagirdzhanova-0007]|nr:MAG: hypothetical protein CYPHOPRED_002394 [Cyphobasidiales sp. Tagirdzhanova-0007]
MSQLLVTLLTLLAGTSVWRTAAANTNKGFSYASTFSDGSVKQYQDYVNEMQAAQKLVGAPGTGFNSARLYTMVQADKNFTNEAVQAAIDTNTTLVLGLWASPGDADFSLEVQMLSSAIAAHQTNLVAGISVGSEDI